MNIGDLEEIKKDLEAELQIEGSLMLRLLSEILKELKDIEHHLRVRD
jgi:hypothetical protein